METLNSATSDGLSPNARRSGGSRSARAPPAWPAPAGPVRGALRNLLQGPHDHLLELRGGDRARHAGPGLVAQAGGPLPDDPAAPLPECLPGGSPAQRPPRYCSRRRRTAARCARSGPGRDLRKLRDERGHYLREGRRVLCGSLIKSANNLPTSNIKILRPWVLDDDVSIAVFRQRETSSPVEDRQRYAIPEQFAQRRLPGVQGPARSSSTRSANRPCPRPPPPLAPHIKTPGS